MEKEKTIVIIECDDGRVFITDNVNAESYHNSNIPNWLFDGEKPQKSFCSGWFVLDKFPKIVQREVSQPNINHRYELIDETMESKKVPKIFNREDVAEKVEYSWEWKDEYSTLRSLYNEVSEAQPNKIEDVDVSLELIMKVKNMPTMSGFSYDAQRTRWESDGLEKITDKDVTYQIIDKLAFPKPILPCRPCKLTSHQTYKIVRQYIKQHINLELAEITSDYAFCVTVKKKIPLSEVENYTVDTSFGHNLFSKRKKKPKMENRFRRERLVEVFEMTHAEEGYKGYTPIKGFEGETQEDLKIKIDGYCKSLIKYINEPFKDCQTCSGLGVIKNEFKQTT